LGSGRCSRDPSSVGSPRCVGTGQLGPLGYLFKRFHKAMRRRAFMTLLAGAGAAWLGAPYALPPARAAARLPLSLTPAHRAEIWRHLSRDAMRASEPAGLKVGEAVPQTMHLLSFARRLRRRIPAIRPYFYTLLHGQVLIVDPASKKIVAIVEEK
jgi:hypothetical protein